MLNSFSAITNQGGAVAELLFFFPFTTIGLSVFDIPLGTIPYASAFPVTRIIDIA